MFQVNITMNGSAKIMRGDLINEVICARVALDTLASRLITLVVSPCVALSAIFCHGFYKYKKTQKTRRDD